MFFLRGVSPFALFTLLAATTSRCSCAFFAPTSVLPGSVRTAISSLPPSTPRTMTTSTRMFATTESASEPQHQINEEAGGAPVELSPAQLAYQTFQREAPKLSHAQEVRSLVAYSHGFAVLGTFSKHHAGYPAGGVVAFAADGQGRPVMALSGLSTHRQDLAANPKCSLTVATKEFKSLADGRVNLLGTCSVVTDPAEVAELRQLFLAKHPNAFWVDFGDFDWIRLEVEHVRFVGGFARVGVITAKEYAAAQPDPIMAFGPAIAKHMNEDHMEATIAMVRTTVPGLQDDDDAGNKITAATITAVDSLGMYVKVTRESPGDFLPQEFKTRLPFPRPAKDRADVKTLIVEMTQQAAA